MSILKLKPLLNKLEQLKEDTKTDYSNKNLQLVAEEVFTECSKFLDTEFADKKLELTRRFYICISYFDYAQTLLYKNGIYKNGMNTTHFIGGGFDEVEIILNIINLFKTALTYTEKCEDCYKYINVELGLTQKIDIIKKDCFNKLAILNLLYLKVEDGIKYCQQGCDAGAKGCISMLVCYYCMEEYLDIDKALYYYNLICNYNIPEYMYSGFEYLYQMYYRKGMYHEALSHLKNFKAKISLLKLDKFYLDNVMPRLNTCLHDCTNKVEELKHHAPIKDIDLKKYFPDDILKIMDTDIKIFITSSLHLYEYITNYNKSNNGTLDYSSATMPAMKALENILFKIFAKNYLPFLQKYPNLDFSKINDKVINEINNKKIIKTNLDVLDNGTIIKLAANTKFNNGKVVYNPNVYFMEFCKTLKILRPDLLIPEFCQKLEVIRNLRNKSAHKQRVLMSDATECFEYLLFSINFIKFLYTYFGDLFK